MGRLTAELPPCGAIVLRSISVSQCQLLKQCDWNVYRGQHCVYVCDAMQLALFHGRG